MRACRSLRVRARTVGRAAGAVLLEDLAEPAGSRSRAKARSRSARTPSMMTDILGPDEAAAAAGGLVIVVVVVVAAASQL